VFRPGIHRPSSSPTTIAAPIQTGRNRSRVESLPTTGVADNTQTTCSFWWRPRINPSDTGNLRFQSLFNLTDQLTLTADANFQYVQATGGSTFFTFKEGSGQMIGATSIAGGGTTTAAFGCISGRGCDLNGDGDVLDTVGLFQPSLTQTHRYGSNVSLIYKFDEKTPSISPIRWIGAITARPAWPALSIPSPGPTSRSAACRIRRIWWKPPTAPRCVSATAAPTPS